MNEGKHTMSSSSLAIVQDKRPPHRPGGCVGILFQLFDWNRRFAKKKLFPKKLLPPVRVTKRVSKKFGGDEKMPMAKFLLIADENRGGFPNTKKPPEIGVAARSSPHSAVPDYGMCAPGLVARLMGLETMPTVTQDKPRKAVDSASCYNGSETSGSSRHDADLDLGMGARGRLELRPQKLQKTGFLERRPVSGRLGSETLQLNRSVLSRTRKQHHKLASPVKSPRFLCRRNSARLIEAAAKILEPGLQNRNKAKCALTYFGSSQGDKEIIDTSIFKRSNEPSSRYLSSCENCGNLVDVADSKSDFQGPPVVDYGYSASDIGCVSSSSEAFNLNKPNPPVCTSDGRSPSLFTTKSNVQTRTRDIVERKPHPRNGLDQGKPREGSTSRGAFRQSSLRQNQVPLVKDRVVVAPGPKLYGRQQNRRDSSSVSKDFISLNRNLNNRARAKMTPKTLSSSKVETERSTWEGKALAHKRRPNSSSQIEGSSASRPSLPKQRSIRKDKIPERVGLAGAASITQNNLRSDSRKLAANGNSTGGNASGIVSFTFNAPFRHDSGPSSSAGDGDNQRCQAESMHAKASQPDKLVTDSRTGNSSPKRVPAFSGDELSALLEQKIRELNCLDRDGLGADDDGHIGKSTASILEELISALTMGGPVHQKKGDHFTTKLGQIDDQSYDSPDPYASANPQWYGDKRMQEEEKKATSAALGSECDQPSPVSILEASFSTDSCLSESLNDNSGCKPQFGFTEPSWDRSQSWERSQSWDPETDLSDSATSTNVRTADRKRASRSLESISIMYSSGLHDTEFLGSKPSFVREVISNMELLFGNISSYETEGTVESSIYSLLLDTLEALLDSFWASTKCNLIFPGLDKSQFRGFLFDCLIEHLDSKYSRYFRSGYNAWKKLPVFLSIDRLMTEVHADLCMWRDFSGKNLDEVIEMEMSHLTGKWTDFEIEAFDTGIEIEHDILQALVNETVIDILSC